MNALDFADFLGAVMIDKLPPKTTVDDVKRVLGTVAVPERDRDSIQHCVTWTVKVILALEAAGYAEQVDVDAVMDAAVAFGAKS